MPPIPKVRRRVLPAVVGAPLASPVDVAADAPARALEGIGQELYKIGLERQKQEDDAFLASSGADLNKTISDEREKARLEVLLDRNQAAENRKRISDLYDSEIERLTKRARASVARRFRNFAMLAKEGKLAGINNIYRAKQLDFQRNDTLRQYTNTFETLANQELPVDEILNHPDVLLTDKAMAPYWKAGEQEDNKNRILSDVLINPKYARYEDAKKLIQNTTMLPSEKNAKRKNIDNTQLADERKILDLNKKADMQVNEDFLVKLMNKELKPNEIVASRLDEGDELGVGIFGLTGKDTLNQQSWLAYSKASFEPPYPGLIISNPSGAAAMTDIVLTYSKFGTDRETAMKKLLDMRYRQKTISDNDFRWAIDKLNNPYPKHLVPDIESAIQNNRRAISQIEGGWLDRLITAPEETEEIRQLNLQLLDWIDERIANDKTPTYKDMQNKSAHLRGQGDKEITRRPVIDTQAEYDKLKSGTEFQDAKTGEFFRKP